MTPKGVTVRRHRLSRRRLLLDLGRAGFGVAVLGAAACGGSEGPDGAASPAASPATSPSASVGPSPGGDGGAAGGIDWRRVDLGFVSAYVLVRGSDAAVVDTGTEGSEGDIEAVLTDAGLGWADVGHLILTHRHPDHIGSVPAVLAAATAATAYAGAGDIPSISAPRDVVAVGDGDSVFGLDVVATPGHTPGHVCVLDPGRLLVAGDALRTDGGAVIGPDPQYTPDMDAAGRSVARLAGLAFETVLVGHGAPVEAGADAQVRALAGVS